MRHVSLQEVLSLHSLIIAQSGGSAGLSSGRFGICGSATRGQFGGEELYPDLATKAAALAHSLIQNHPFIDGNKRIGHGAMEVFLLLNGHEMDATVDGQEEIIIGVASGKIARIELGEWLREHMVVQNSLR